MNRLASEQSPYLLQHAGNPVDWFPWGEAAFSRARAEDKPIFLSVGYSTCHWCHVMEHESFESQAIADVLNAHFVSIKVDREERPDVDRVYMAFVQATTGSGGWPMSVWLTPALEPFYGGTYFPPDGRWGRPGFRDVLIEIARAWREDRIEVVKSAAQIVGQLSAMAGDRRSGAGGDVTDETLAAIVRQFARAFDRRRGGFGEAPKFPRPSELWFLLREHARTGDEAARDMVVETLRAMALGGMRDHIGGGFHRYSVDANWRVPHFEKMLYDQAQLVLAYLEAAQASGDAFFAQIAEDTLQYVAREMTDSRGGFYSAEDADSVPPELAGQPSARKTEGAFYIWSLDEVRRALGDASRPFELRYGLLANGNAPFDPQEEFTGKNLLYTARGIADIATETGTAPQVVADALTEARTTLFAIRGTRPRPHLDDKVLTAWNGLMVAAFARAGRVLAGGGALAQPVADDPGARHLAAARRAARFIKDTLWNDTTGVLLRRYRDGDAGIEGYAEDYAFLVFGLLELLQADGDPDWLDWALSLQRRQDELFAHPEGGWYSTTGRDPSVLVRLKEEYDGAEPSASAVGAWNLLTLHQLTGDAAFEAAADGVIRAAAGALSTQGRAIPMMAAVASRRLSPPSQIVVLGPWPSEGTARLWEAAHRAYRPFAVTLRVQPGPAQARLAAHMPWLREMRLIDGQPTAYVCRDFACDRPTTRPEDLK